MDTVLALCAAAALPPALWFGWVAWVVANESIAKRWPERFADAGTCARVPLHLRLPAFRHRREALVHLGFRDRGAAWDRAALLRIPSHVAWSPGLGVYAWTFSFLGRPQTGLYTVIETGVTSRDWTWKGPLFAGGREGTLHERLRWHLGAVRQAAAARGVPEQGVGDGTLATYVALTRWVFRCNARPGSVGPFAPPAA